MSREEKHALEVQAAGIPSVDEEEVSKDELEELLRKVDKESATRRLFGMPRWIVYWIGVAFSGFQVYTAAFGLLPAQLQRSVHLAFVFVLIYLLFPFRSSKDSDRLRWYDYLLAAFAGFVGLYVLLNYTRIMEAGGDYLPVDFFFAGCGILLTLEAARRAVGMPIVIIASSFLIYAYLGAYFPGFLAHRGYSLQRIASHMYFTTEGILGIPLGVSASFIYLFILFGAFSERSGMGQLFIDVSNAIAGWASGGPAKVAVVTSAFEGMVSGSSVANTVQSGAFTIPMMKRLGYRPEFAAAVEASASTGGQIMPPVMGAAAFIMAEFLNIPYLDIAKAAAIPACLYFFGIFIEVHYEARRCKLRGMNRDELPRFGRVMAERGYMFLPLCAIIGFLVSGYTPLYAALMGLILCVLASYLRRSTWMMPRDIADAFEQGARNAVGVAVACATAGIIIGVVTLTGLGLKFAHGLIELAGGYLLPTLFFTMITSLILGMGVPTTANYIITSTIAAPGLILLAVHPLAAHMFVFYFGIIADLTPPVALAAYAGSGIARSDPMKTGFIATKLAIGAFLVPYIFVYNPAMLLVGITPFGLIQNLVTACCGMFGAGVAMIGYCQTTMRWWERVWFFVGGLMLIDPGMLTDLIGVVMLGVGLVYQWYRKKTEGKPAEAECAADN